MSAPRDHTIAAWGPFILVADQGGRGHIEDTTDHTTSSPLAPELVSMFRAHPEWMLDIQLQCSTPRVKTDDIGVASMMFDIEEEGR